MRHSMYVQPRPSISCRHIFFWVAYEGFSAMKVAAKRLECVPRTAEDTSPRRAVYLFVPAKLYDEILESQAR